MFLTLGGGLLFLDLGEGLMFLPLKGLRIAKMGVMTLTGPLSKLFLNSASHDTKIGCIGLIWAEAKQGNFHFCYAQAL